jgi:hypothetical protein
VFFNRQVSVPVHLGGQQDPLAAFDYRSIYRICLRRWRP